MVQRIRCPYCRSLLDPEEDWGARRTCPTCRIAITEPLIIEGSTVGALLGALITALVLVIGELTLLNGGAYVYGLFTQDPHWNVAQGGASCTCMFSLLVAPVAAGVGAILGAWLGWRIPFARTTTAGRPRGLRGPTDHQPPKPGD